MPTGGALPAAGAIVTARIPAKYLEEIDECARCHMDLLYRFLFRFTRGDHALSEDLVQQVLMQAAENWADLRGLDSSNLRDRLYLLATRRAVDMFRKNEVAREYLSAMERVIETQWSDVHEDAQTMSAVQRFVEVIGALPPRQALAAMLYWRCDWTNGEIADAMNVTPAAVSQLVAKARMVLKQELLPYSSFDAPETKGGA